MSKSLLAVIVDALSGDDTMATIAMCCVELVLGVGGIGKIGGGEYLIWWKGRGDEREALSRDPIFRQYPGNRNSRKIQPSSIIIKSK